MPKTENKTRQIFVLGTFHLQSCSQNGHNREAT